MRLMCLILFVFFTIETVALYKASIKKSLSVFHTIYITFSIFIVAITAGVLWGGLTFPYFM